MTPTEFKTMFPEFSAETDERVQMMLDRSVPYFNVTRWGCFYSEGVGNFVAHELEMSNRRARETALGVSTANDEVSRRVGEVSASRDAAMAAASQRNPFLMTGYGATYFNLVKRVGRGGVVV